MPANLLAMASLNEQVHVAAWPNGAGIQDHPFSLENNVNASVYYASTNGVYVLMASQIFSEEMKEMLGGVPQSVGEGHAGIINPNGMIISDPIHRQQEGIAYAEIDLNTIIQTKYFIDPAGHYSKASVCRLIFNQSPQDTVTLTGKQKEYYVSSEELQEE
jgi:cyanide dihydratase